MSMRAYSVAILLIGVTPVIQCAVQPSLLQGMNAEIQQLISDWLPSIVAIAPRQSNASLTGNLTNQLPVPFGFTQSRGTGFFLSQPGIIVASLDSVGDDTTVDVLFSDGKQDIAHVLGYDQLTQVVILKCSRQTIRPFIPRTDPVPFGTSVITLAYSNRGIPLFESAYVSYDTTEIINSIDILYAPIHFLPGMSGGVVLDTNGRLIGMMQPIKESESYDTKVSNVYKSFSAKTSAGLPSETEILSVTWLEWIAQQIISNGKVERGWLGMVIEEAHLPKGQLGAVIQEITESGPAAKAGLSVGDVLIEFEDKPITRLYDLIKHVQMQSPGSTIHLTRLKNSKVEKKIVQIGVMPESAPETAEEMKTRYGFSVIPLTNMHLHQNASVEKTGFVITHITPNSSADLAGIKPGDIIQTISKNDEKMSDPHTIITVLVAGENPQLTLHMLISGRNLTFTVNRE